MESKSFSIKGFEWGGAGLMGWLRVAMASGAVWMAWGAGLGGAAEIGGSVGFVTFVNALGEPGPVRLSIDGRAIGALGFDPGSVSGGMGIDVGIREFAVTHPARGTVRGRMEVRAGEPAILIVYSVRTGREKDGNEKRSMKFHRLVHQASPHVAFSAISLASTNRLGVTIGGKAVELGRGVAVPTGEEGGTSIRVESEGHTLLNLAAEGSDPCRWVIVVAEAPGGTLSAVGVPDLPHGLEDRE